VTAMKVKHKYKVGEKVYYRPSVLRGSGCKVYHCEVVEAKGSTGKSPYYELKSIGKEKFRFFVIYEDYNLSRKPERLIKLALDEIELKFGGYIRTYNSYKRQLQKIKRKVK